jgi:hypothetical protein
MAKKGNGSSTTLKSPLYSSGTSEQGAKNNQGSVGGPTKAPSPDDPLGYCHGKKGK